MEEYTATEITEDMEDIRLTNNYGFGKYNSHASPEDKHTAAATASEVSDQEESTREYEGMDIEPEDFNICKH